MINNKNTGFRLTKTFLATVSMLLFVSEWPEIRTLVVDCHQHKRLIVFVVVRFCSFEILMVFASFVVFEDLIVGLLFVCEISEYCLYIFFIM
jgi:hypothetical protein